MKILLTGLPRSGKTTIVENYINNVDEKLGFITKEIRKDNERVGFELVSSVGERAMLASVASKSKIKVSRYGVEIESLNNFLEKLPSPNESKLLYIDEIGQMELYSEAFKELTLNWLDLGNNFLGTISKIYSDEFTEKIRKMNNIKILEVTEDSRETIAKEIQKLFK